MRPRSHPHPHRLQRPVQPQFCPCRIPAANCGATAVVRGGNLHLRRYVRMCMMLYIMEHHDDCARASRYATRSLVSGMVPVRLRACVASIDIDTSFYIRGCGAAQVPAALCRAVPSSHRAIIPLVSSELSLTHAGQSLSTPVLRWDAFRRWARGASSSCMDGRGPVCDLLFAVGKPTLASDSCANSNHLPSYRLGQP